MVKHFEHPPEAYKHIKAWGIMMGSFSGYIEGQQNLASRDGAPLTAVFQSIDWSKPGGKGEWAIIEDAHPNTRQRIEAILKTI